VLPPKLAAFKLGQRVCFHWNGCEIVFAGKPTRAIGGKLLSNLIRWGAPTLRLYGPRASLRG
jgi:hypothetical protein